MEEGETYNLMITDTDPDLLKKIKQKDIDSIVEWFEKRKDKLYKFAYVYVKNSEVIQEVFYKVICRVYKEIRNGKRNPSLEKWMFTLFMQECKQINPRSSTVTIFDRIDETCKDSIVLSYVVGLSVDEVAEILEISVKTVKARLHKGIRSLSGVEEGHYQDKFLDYLSRTLKRPEKIELEIHLHTCQACQNHLTAFQDTIHLLIDETESINVPTGLFENVHNKINQIEEEKERKKRKRRITGGGIAAILVLFVFIGYMTNSFSYLYYYWLDWRGEEDEQLLAYLKSGLGDSLNLVSENNGIKVTIKTAIADEFQTLIYYEVENLEGQEQYAINVWDGVLIPDETTTLDHATYPINHLAVQPLDMKENIFKGTISLLPILDETKTLKLNISKLQKMDDDIEKSIWMHNYGVEGFTYGNWDFEIPIVKVPSKNHEVENMITVDGIPIHFKNLIIAPTVTVLQFQLETYNNERNINDIFFKGLQTKDKTVKPLLYGYSYPVHGGEGGYTGFQSVFHSLYFENQNEVDVLLSSLSYYKDDNINVDLDINQPFPQVFEYLGSNISIESIQLGQPTKLELKAEWDESRKFESLNFEVLNHYDLPPSTMGMMDIDGIFVDRDGKEYTMEEYNYHSWIEGKDIPRHYQRKMVIELQNDQSNEEFIPSKLRIHGYHGTIYSDDVVNLKLK